MQSSDVPQDEPRRMGGGRACRQTDRLTGRLAHPVGASPLPVGQVPA
jgi:hypothetical protein